MLILFRKSYLVCAFICAIAAQSLAAQSENDLLDQLRSDYAAMTYARSEYEQGIESGSVSDSEKLDYAVWLDQLENQVVEGCRALSGYSQPEALVDIPCAEFTEIYSGAVNIDIEHETTDGEKTAAMTDQFNESLGEFDEKLLTEQDRVKNQKPRVESENAGAGAAGGGDSGSDSEQGSESGSMSEESGAGENSPGRQQGNESETGTNFPSGGAAGEPSPAGNSNIPDDIPDGSDDDVIARQLREAAEKETDPELQKKLWEEYRRYKSG